MRGAFNFLANMTPEARANGVICASAGNHAQGVAMAARHLVSWRNAWVTLDVILVSLTLQSKRFFDAFCLAKAAALQGYCCWIFSTLAVLRNHSKKGSEAMFISFHGFFRYLSVPF